MQVLFNWLGLLCQISMIFSAAQLIEKLFQNTQQTNDMIVFGCVLVCALVLRFVFDRFSAKMSFSASADVKRVLRENICGKLLRLGASYRESVSTSSVVQLAVEGVDQLETYFGKYISQLFYSLLAPLTLFALLSFVNFKTALVLLICVPLIPMSIVLVQKIAKKLLSKYWGAYEQLGDSFLENLQGLTTLKIYQADGKAADEMDWRGEHFRRITMKVLTMQLNSTSVMDIMAYGGAAVGMIVVLCEFFAGNVTLSGTLMILLLASVFFIPLRLLGSFFHIAMNGMAASDKIFELLDLPEPEEKSETLKNEATEIKINDLSFSYTEEREILHDINMSIPVGMTSVVGTSGSGKSTIAAVLMGRNKKYGGNVMIQGKELSMINEASLMQNVTLVTHGMLHLQGGVYAIICLMGKPMRLTRSFMPLWKNRISRTLSNRMVVWKCSSARAARTFRAVSVSGCLWRVPYCTTALFTSLTRRPATSTSRGEEMIMNVIKNLTKPKPFCKSPTVWRMSRIVKEIYMLDGGIIAESGTHNGVDGAKR